MVIPLQMGDHALKKQLTQIQKKLFRRIEEELMMLRREGVVFDEKQLLEESDFYRSLNILQKEKFRLSNSEIMMARK